MRSLVQIYDYATSVWFKATSIEHFVKLELITVDMFCETSSLKSSTQLSTKHIKSKFRLTQSHELMESINYSIYSDGKINVKTSARVARPGTYV